MFTDWIENFGAAITVMDLEGNILDMNEAAAVVNERHGGKSLIGKNLMGCHQQRSRDIMKNLMENDTKNVYTIEKNGKKKMIYQAPWYKDGKVAGLVEISMFVPEEMPHYKRS